VPPPPAEKPTSQTQSEPTSAAALRGLNVWPEVIEQLRSRDAALSSFLGQARAAQSADGTVILRVPNPFLISMLDRPNNRDLLISAIAAQADTPPTGLKFEVVKAADNAPDDEIFTAIES
jgi:hypothetical protein